MDNLPVVYLPMKYSNLPLSTCYRKGYQARQQGQPKRPPYKQRASASYRQCGNSWGRMANEAWADGWAEADNHPAPTGEEE